MSRCRSCRCLIGRFVHRWNSSLGWAAARETLTCSSMESLVRAAYTNREHSRSTISAYERNVFLLLRTERVGTWSSLTARSSCCSRYKQCACTCTLPTARLHRENHQQFIIIYHFRRVAISCTSLRIRKAPVYCATAPNIGLYKQP